MSRIDVVVPCYQYGRYLRQCVTSVLDQSVDGIRVLIIDDCSTDETAEIAKRLAAEDERVEFRRHSRNRGHIATYNEGIAWSEGKFFLLLSADDFVLPGAFARALALLEANPGVAFVFGGCVQLRPGQPLPRVEPGATGSRILDPYDFVRISGSRNIVETPTAIILGELQRRVGGYRPDLPHAGDMEMWLRLARYGQVGTISALQGVRRVHESNMSHGYAGRISDLQQRKKIFEEFFAAADRPPGVDQLRRSIYMALADDAVMVAANAFRHGELKACREILALAETLCPQVRRTGAWRTLAVKRRLGYRLSSALRPFVTRLRAIGPARLPRHESIRGAPSGTSD
jgi:glycosyltransferase involved in cell wall biosynthesis